MSEQNKDPLAKWKAFGKKALEQATETAKKNPVITGAAGGFILGGPVGALLGGAAATEQGQKLIKDATDKAQKLGTEFIERAQNQSEAPEADDAAPGNDATETPEANDNDRKNGPSPAP